MNTNNWIVTYKTAKPVNYRIFAFCNGGAGASVYYSWKDSIPDGVEFCVIQLPGRENRHQEKYIVSMPALASALCEALLNYQSLPFIFLGHSIGVLIAFETARELHHRGLELPKALFLAGLTPPDKVVRPPIYQLPEPEFIRAIAKYYGAIPEDKLAHQKFKDMYLNTLRADTELADTYQYQKASPLPIPFYIFGGKQDPLATKELLADWQAHSSKIISLSMLAGDHFFIHQHKEKIIELINEVLRHGK